MRKMIRCIRIVVWLFPIIFNSQSTIAYANSASKISDIESTIVAICHTAPSLSNHTGTGFIASHDGVVVTADHVINDRHGKVYDRLFCIRPNYPDYENYELVLLKRFRSGQSGRDIAILKIKNEAHHGTFPFLSIGEDVEIGQPVFTAGFPNAFKGIYLWPLFRKGSVSSIRYNYENSEVIVLDLKAIAGYSGAPIITEKGVRVIGVMKGKNVKSSDGDFSVAVPLRTEDLLVK